MVSMLSFSQTPLRYVISGGLSTILIASSETLSAGRLSTWLLSL